MSFNANTTFGFSGGGNGGGGVVPNPRFGSFYDTTIQKNGDSGVPFAMRLNTTDISNGFSIQPRTVSATASISGTTLTCTAILSGRFYPNMLISGSGVTPQTAMFVQLTSTSAIVANPTLTGGGLSGASTFVVSSVAGIALRQFVTGTNLPAGTRVVYIDAGTNTITVSNAFTGNGAGTYNFRDWGYEGTYTVSEAQAVASTTISGSTYSKITAAYSGTYDLQFSAQYDRTGTGSDSVSIWLEKNGVAVDNTCTDLLVAGNPAQSPVVAAWNFFVTMNAGDYLEIVWSSPTTEIEIQSKVARLSPYRPAIPSVIVTINTVSV